MTELIKRAQQVGFLPVIFHSDAQLISYKQLLQAACAQNTVEIFLAQGPTASAQAALHMQKAYRDGDRRPLILIYDFQEIFDQPQLLLWHAIKGKMQTASTTAPVIALTSRKDWPALVGPPRAKVTIDFQNIVDVSI